MNSQKLFRLFPRASDECEDLRGIDIGPIYKAYLRTGSVHRAGKEFGISGDTVHQYLKKAGKKLRNANWSNAEIQLLRQAYADPSRVNVPALAQQLGRPYAGIACKAEELGLTSGRGHQVKRPETLQLMGRIISERWKKQGHPRGMAGKKHTQETKDKISEKGTGRIIPPEQILRSMKARVAKYGSMSPPRAGRGSWKASWREIGGQRIYARSRWEANYARYLQLLLDGGEILKWEHEPETFWFEGASEAPRSYLPDFRVTLEVGIFEYHEVKGWMDDVSKAKINRMAEYYPSITLVVRDKAWFKSNRKALSKLIPEWES